MRGKRGGRGQYTQTVKGSDITREEEEECKEGGGGVIPGRAKRDLIR